MNPTNFKLTIFKSTILALSVLVSTSLVAENGKPNLWKVQKDDNISYLFGSIHLGSKDMYPLSKVINDAYAKSDHLVVEVDVTDKEQAAMAPLIRKLGLDLSTPIEKRLSTKVLKIYNKACRKKALRCSQLTSYKVWLLSLQLSIMKIKQLGYDSKFGIDKHFLSRAHKSNKTVISLESSESQLLLLSGFSQQQQELMLLQTLQANDQYYVDLVDAWKTGDDDKILFSSVGDMEESGAIEMYNAIFTNRNFKMVDKIIENINAKKSLFIVVGAGHIVGKNGLLNLLKKHGFRLTQIQ